MALPIEVRTTPVLNAFRLTLFGVLLGVGLTVGLAAASFDDGPWWERTAIGIVAGFAAVGLTAGLLILGRRPIARLMKVILPGD